MSEIQDVYNRLAEIEQKLAHINAEIEVAGKALGGSGSSGGGLNSSVRALNMGVTAVQKFSGSDTLEAATAKIKQSVGWINQLQFVLLAFSAANPVTAAFAVAGLGMNVASQIQSGGV